MVYVFNLQNIHSLSNVVILFTIKTCQPCHYIKPMTNVYTRERHENKLRVSGLPMSKVENCEKTLTHLPCIQVVFFVDLNKLPIFSLSTAYHLLPYHNQHQHLHLQDAV